MAPNNNNYQEIISRVKGVAFTKSQALEFERFMLKAPTGTNSSYEWVGNKTKQSINFNCYR